MTESVRCPACRGAKKVPKLGGIIGECNTCSGKGTILAVDKPKPVIAEAVESNVDIIKAVSEAIPFKAKEEFVPLCASEPTKDIQVKVDPKKAIYKRKKA